MNNMYFNKEEEAYNNLLKKISIMWTYLSFEIQNLLISPRHFLNMLLSSGYSMDEIKFILQFEFEEKAKEFAERTKNKTRKETKKQTDRDVERNCKKVSKKDVKKDDEPVFSL